MAGLALGIPVITTAGRLTEPLWAETGCVVLADVNDARTLATEALGLLSDDRQRRALGERGRDVYASHFDVSHTIGALRAAGECACVSPS